MTSVNAQGHPGDVVLDYSAARQPLRPTRWVFTAVVLVLFAQAVHFVVTDRRFEWNVVWRYLFNTHVLEGVGVTVYLTIISMGVGLVLGIGLVACRLAANPVLSWIARAYIWFFRSTPQLVQLILWFNIALLLPQIGIGIPFLEPFVKLSANKVITPLVAAIVGLGLREAAYQAEIYRAGLMAVDPGQIDAARSIGLGPARIFFRVRLPQAMKVIIPPTVSAIIGMTQATALVSVIGGAELLFEVTQIYSTNFETVPLLIVASLWYLALTTVINLVEYLASAYRRRSGRPKSVGERLEFMFEDTAV